MNEAVDMPRGRIGGRSNRTRDEFRLEGISVRNITMSEAVEAVLSIEENGKTRQIHFVNAHCVNIASRDREYLRILKEADIVFPDGIGVKLAGLLLGTEVKENVNGTDMFPLLCEALSGSGRSLFLFGGPPGGAEKVGAWIGRNYPGVRVSGFEHGTVPLEREDYLIRKINDSEADLLLIALGVPLQEKWLDRNVSRLRPRVAMGVGGLFDFYSGQIPRAPQWMRKTGLEWTYRLYQEPKRMWRRYIVGNPEFLWRVLRARYLRRKPNSNGTAPEQQ